MSYMLTPGRSRLVANTLRGRASNVDSLRSKIDETQGVDIGGASFSPDVDYSFREPGVAIRSGPNGLESYDADGGLQRPVQPFAAGGEDYTTTMPGPGDVRIVGRARGQGTRDQHPRRFMPHLGVSDPAWGQPASLDFYNPAYYIDERLRPILAPNTAATPELDNYVDHRSRQPEQSQEMLVGSKNPALDNAYDEAAKLQKAQPPPRPQAQPGPKPGPALDPESGAKLPPELASDDPTPKERGWFDDMGRYRGEGYSFGQRPLMGYGRAIAENMGADANLANWAERGGAGLLAVGVGLPALLAAADALQDDPVQPIVISNRS